MSSSWESLGYSIVRRKGSHVHLRKMTASGQHTTTVPDHKIVAKGTLNDVISAVSVRNGIPKQDLMRRLR
jgi:predicted RNA binding protein YcfA (HicA-like mRNA interferase family)